MHPETEHGIAGAVGKHGAVANLATAESKVSRFTSETAKVTGKSERSVQRAAEQGEKIADAIRTHLLLLFYFFQVMAQVFDFLLVLVGAHGLEPWTR